MRKQDMSHNKEQTSQSQKIHVVSNEENLIDAKDCTASPLSHVTGTNSQKANNKDMHRRYFLILIINKFVF
jgi:hypothetical protein